MKSDQQLTARLNTLEKELAAKNRELEIEAALEKVRSRSLAMHNPDELREVVAVVFDQLKALYFRMDEGAAVIIIFLEGSKDHIQWIADPDQSYAHSFKTPYTDHSIPSDIFNAKQSGIDFFSKLYPFEEKNNYFKYLFEHTDYKYLPDYVKTMILESRSYGFSIVFEKNSAILIPTRTGKLLSKDKIDVLKRFAKVFEQAYIRFNDLQKAEAQAREAVQQAALDRIRADITSMRTITDLERITPLIWNELTTLGVPFIRCGVFIMDDAHELIHTFLSTPDGKAIAAFHLPYDTQGHFQEVVNCWRTRKIYISCWSEDDFISIAEILVKQGAIATKEQYLDTLPKGGFYLHFLPFLQGMLYVGNTTQLGEEETKLIQSVADAFSTAYARYEDFNKLEAAKKQVDSTLNELRATQAQLIQKEKMASLGELTAGIAHEIQNPLNFVNNFSEVSSELVEELKQEIVADHKADALAIADDLTQNVEKISHHGKRADSIVKNMLQHSRASSGEKQPTDLNKLADEYLRLSYHGMRAKDKEFNAALATDFDESLGKVEVVPQELGRVLLNLFNNAFYAIEQKKYLFNGQYQPEVKVSTRKLADKIEISVKDNGTGMTEAVKQKIFQPFFTTKPTGEGTGLGLSLSYDIITKGYGGELKVESKEGEFTEFVMLLPDQRAKG